MKDDKICFSKTFTYLVLLIAVVFGAFWMMNYANSQKLTQNSKAAEPTSQQRIVFDKWCRDKTGDSRSTCGLASVCYPSSTRKKFSPTTICGQDINGDGDLNDFVDFKAGVCCVDKVSAVVPTTVVPTTVVPTFNCSSLKGKIAKLPEGEVPRYNKIIKRYFAGLQVYSGTARKEVRSNDPLWDPLLACKFEYKTCVSDITGRPDLGRTAFNKTSVCYTPKPFITLSKAEQNSIANYCNGKAGIISQKYGTNEYRVFSGDTLDNPQYDVRFNIDNVIPSGDVAYCALDATSCKGGTNYIGTKCGGYAL